MIRNSAHRGRLRTRRSGQALVEFALIAPILLLLVLGVVEFGRALQVYLVVTDAAREGARNAAIANDAITQDSVVLRINQHLEAARIDTASAIKSTSGARWDADYVTNGPVRVTIQLPYTFAVIRGLMGWSGTDATITMRTAITMRNES